MGATNCDKIQEMADCYAEKDCCQVGSKIVSVASTQRKCSSKIQCKKSGDKVDGDKVKTNNPAAVDKSDKKTCDTAAATKCTEMLGSSTTCSKVQSVASCFFDANCCQVGAASIMVANTQMNCDPKVECKASTNAAARVATSFGFALALVFGAF